MNRSLKKIPLAALCAAMAAACAGGATDATITVDASKVEGSVTPWLYGACIEDVNHEIYGGLYDQRIFGESFEEPVPNPLFDDCSAYEGEWQVAGDELLCAAHAGAKLVYDPLEMAAGEVETELKFTRGGGGDNAGLLAGVSEPGNGADNFHGYEISLAADGRKVVLGKHKNNFTPIADAAVSCDPAQWNRLGFKTDGRTLQVFLNGACVLRAEDDDPVLARGRVALRTWNSEARFRNVKVTADGASRKLVFRTTPAVQVSRQWDAFSTGGAVAAYRHEAGDAYNGACSQSVEFVSGTGTVGIANAGLNRWGIAVRKGQTFEGRLYLRGSGDVVVALQSADGTKEYASQRITGIGAAWKKFPFELTAAAADGDARFALYLDRPGRVQADQVTLMSTGEDRFRGLPLRGDIGQAMVDQGLTFLRYGGTMINISGYRFKKMIGDRDKRPPYHGHWYRWSTNGFGIEDFLQFCEKAGFTAAFAVNIEETPQDMADMIEYLNGPVTSEWGRRRAENGHPEPYGVKYIGIGNEDLITDVFEERFTMIFNAIKEKYPEMIVVGTVGPFNEGTDYVEGWKLADKLGIPMVDEHYYQTPGWFLNNQDFYDKYDRSKKTKVYLGEYATHIPGRKANIETALTEALYLAALERNGDVVHMTSYAPLLAKEGHTQWNPDLIYFNNREVKPTTGYYVQKLYGQNAGNEYLPSKITLDNRDDQVRKRIASSIVRDSASGDVIVKLVNLLPVEVNTNVDLSGIGAIQSSAKRTVLTGKPADTPLPVEDTMEVAEKFDYQLPAYSFTVIRIKKANEK